MIKLLILFASGPLVFLIIRAMLGINKPILSINRFFLFLYLTTVIIYLLAVYAGINNFYVKGYRSTSILFILMGGFGLVYWLIDRQAVFQSPVRFLMFAFAVITIALSCGLIYEMTGDHKKQLYYTDDKFRLEDTRRGINEPFLLPTLYVKNSWYEQRFNPTIDSLYHSEYLCLTKENISEIKIATFDKSSVKVAYSLKDCADAKANRIMITYTKE